MQPQRAQNQVRPRPRQCGDDLELRWGDPGDEIRQHAGQGGGCLTALSELDLSDNDISDLQALIDTRILKGGTLDLTDNPLGSLAWHVQLPLLEQYAGEVTYNDVLGHESDGLRTLVVGVRQGTGGIAINTVPTGGVETHELRNYEDETYDLLLAEYPAETGTAETPSNPVSITATPADVDGHLDYWMGAYFAFGPRDEAELAVILFEDTKLNAVMKVSPGLGTLDLVADFEDFVAEVLPAEDWETLDENGISYDSELTPVFTGNGMPEVAELGLLNAVLKDTALDFSSRSGVVSYFTWQAWEQNLATAEAQLDGPISGLSGKPYLARVVAAYLTLGDYASTAWIDVVMDAYAGSDVLDLDAYDRSKQRYLKHDADADNEGALNIEEWQGLTLTGIIEDDIAAYAEVALDPEVRPDSAKAAGGGSKQVVAVDCPNANCIPTVQIGVWDPQTPPLFGPPDPLTHENTVRVIRGDTGETIPPGSNVAVPIGTRILVLATPDTGKRFGFLGWSATDTLIHGSRQPADAFYATEDTFIAAGFGRNTVVVPANSTYITYTVGGALNAGPHPTQSGLVRYVLRPDQVATLTGASTSFNPVMWILTGCSSCADPSHSRTNPVTVRHAPYARIGARSASEQLAAVALEASRGGDLRGSSNEHNVGRVMGSVTDVEGSLVRVDAYADAGYKFAGFSSQGVGFSGWNGNYVYGPTTAFYFAGQTASVAAQFQEKEEYILDLKPDGEDVPCSGYAAAEPAQKYYPAGTWVTLTATPLPGYKFVEWGGSAYTWQLGESLYSPEISFTMDRDYGVTAVFAKEFPNVPIEAFNPDTCEYCIHGGYPNAKIPGTDTPGPEGYLIGDVRFGALPEGLERYPETRDAGGDDWGCAYYIHQKLRDMASAWHVLNPGNPIKFNDISKEHGGPWDHSSHQNGLDVDIEYQSTTALSNDLIELFTDDPQCEFVFVTHDTAINAGGNVKRIDGHTTHFHVRFSDPDGLPPIN